MGNKSSSRRRNTNASSPSPGNARHRRRHSEPLHRRSLLGASHGEPLRPRTPLGASLGASASSASSSTSTNPSTTAPSAGDPPAPPRAPAVPSAPSRQTPAPPPTDPNALSMYCQCPQCKRHLQTPPGHRRFQCPCGKKIEIVPPAPPKLVKCPKCELTLSPPKGVDVFCCPCGETLSMPRVAGQWHCKLCKHQNFVRANCEMCGATPTGHLKDSGSTEDPESAEANYGKQRAEAVQASKDTWRRTRFQGMVKDTSGKLIVQNTFRWQYNAHYDCTKQYTIDREYIETLAVPELKRRLALMSVDCSKCLEKTELCDLLFKSEETLMEKPVKILRVLLMQNCIVTRCVEKKDLVSCLVQHLVLDRERPESAMGWVRNIDAQSKLTLIHAEDFSMSLQKCKIPLVQLCAVAAMPFKGKLNWFRTQLSNMRIPVEAGQIKVRVRRSHLLQDAFDSFAQIMQLVNFRRHFKFEFIGEPAIDAGGVAREWFTCVINSLFNVNFGLFKYGQDQLCFQINEFSGIANDMHLRYFRFAGRLLGKALFDRQVCPAHLALPLYKHLLAYPIVVDDLDFVDAEVNSNLKQVFDIEDAEDLCLDFTITEDAFGVATTKALKPGGEDIEVDNNNRKEYVQLMFNHYMTKSSDQLAEFLQGFYDIIPEYLLAIFDFMELELICCGLPNLDVTDWREHTIYKGVFHAQHNVIQWFWEVVVNYSQEKRARLLQFATSTSRVPVAGFKQLQSNVGRPCSFQLQSIPLKSGPFPKAHTCFNRIDLPLYKTKADLEKYLTIAITCESSGFGLE